MRVDIVYLAFRCARRSMRRERIAGMLICMYKSKWMEKGQGLKN